MKTKVSDLVARFFARKGVSHGFGIIGSANSHLFDSIFNTTPEIELVCNHHEQACTMAVQTYWKIRGVPTFALVTAGAGSSNAITGVLSAWENASRLAHPFLSEAFLAQERRDLSAVYMPVADTWVVEADGLN